MAYQNLQTPLTTKNGVSYNLQYDPTNGYVQAIQNNAAAGTQPIFSNGNFTNAATTAGFTSAEQQSLYSNIQSSVRGAYTISGGNTKGYTLPQWAQLTNQGNTPGQTSVTPSSSGSGTGGSSSGSNFGSIFGNILNPAASLNQLNNQNNFGFNGENLGTSVYPVDMRVNKQDVLRIVQYRYEPPSANLFQGGQPNILTQGLQRGSDFASGTSELKGTVYLPMPSSITDSNSVGWGEDSMNNLNASVAANAFKNPLITAAASAAGYVAGGPNGAAFGSMATNLIQEATKGNLGGNTPIAQLMSAMATSKVIKQSGLQVSTETILARGAGIVPNNNLELLFNGPVLRLFNFSYRMTARSEEEAIAIRKILRFFKQGMAAKKANATGGGNFFLRTPNIFKLSYLNNGKEIDGVNRFKTCALQNFGCNYTPDGFWASYDGGQPVSVTMAMSFAELEPIYDTDYDNSKVSSNSVGY